MQKMPASVSARTTGRTKQKTWREKHEAAMGLPSPHHIGGIVVKIEELVWRIRQTVARRRKASGSGLLRTNSAEKTARGPKRSGTAGNTSTMCRLRSHRLFRNVHAQCCGG
jgi:hypothetical protein